MARSPAATTGPGSAKKGEAHNEAPAVVQRRLLIVEDSEGTRKQLQHLLATELSVAVDTAADGTEALEALIERNYSLVITDLKMPRVDGMQVVEEVQKRRLPVTVLTKLDA